MEIKIIKRIDSNVFWNFLKSQVHTCGNFAFISKIQEAVDIGKEFQQKAIYYVKDGNLKLIECCTEKLKSLATSMIVIPRSAK